MRTQLARRFAWASLGLVAILTVVALANWETTYSLIQRNDAFLKLIGLAIGPLLALLGFLWGLVDKAELKDLSEELGEARQAAASERTTVEKLSKDAEEKLKRIKVLENDIATILNSGRLGKLRESKPFPEYSGWKNSRHGARILTTALFKGGVGKTHVAANLAAYVSEYRQQPVLLVDLDYQGSLSTMVMTAAGIDPCGSRVDALFREGADLGTLCASRIQLANSGNGVALNSGRGLSRGWLVPADYTLSEVEANLLASRVMENSSKLDERFRLAHVLLDPEVRREFALIIIDTPPRMTLGTVNAFVASHYFLMPSILDRVSAEAAAPFLRQLRLLKEDLALDVDLVGIVGTMTRYQQPSDREKKYLTTVVETAAATLGIAKESFDVGTFPIKPQIQSSDDLGYFLRDSDGPLSRFYNPFFDKLWNRMCSPPGAAAG